MRLKPFGRFPHSGVRAELEAVIREVGTFGRFEFGSSGDGEVTTRNGQITAYVRKYRKGDKEWRVHICRPGVTSQPTYPKTQSEVLALLRQEMLREGALPS